MKQYIDKSALIAAIKERSKYNGTRAELDRSSFMAGREQEDQVILALLDSLEVKEVKEEPVSNTILLYGLSGGVGIEEAVKETEEYKEWQGDPERQQSFIDFAKFGANYKHHTNKDLEKEIQETQCMKSIKEKVEELYRIPRGDDTEDTVALDLEKAVAFTEGAYYVIEEIGKVIYKVINELKK